MVMRGFACDGADLIAERWSLEKFQKIVEWGFDTILVTFWWGKLERQDGTYQTTRIDRIKSQVDLALEAHLNVILSMRVCYEPSGDPSYRTDWTNRLPTHDYVNTNSVGRDRYAKFLRMIAEEFPNCKYCLWHFPYHKQSVDAETKRLFYDVTMPSLINAIREVNNNEIVFVPIYQGATRNGETADYYLTAEPLTDPNIIYALSHMIPWTVVNGEWDKDENKMVTAFAGVKHWTETYGLPMMSIEYAPLSWNGKPLTQTRLDCLKSSLDKMDDYQVGFAYWRLWLLKRQSANVLSDLANFEANPNILKVLQGYEVVVPEQEDTRFLLPLFLLFVFFGIVLMSGSTSGKGVFE